MREEEADGDGERSGGGELTMGRNNDVDRVREMQLSIAASSSVFPGFRFSPTDDELISYYLKKKLQGSDNCVDIIPEVDFCRHEPWDLPGKKYPNGSQSRRATQSGYWKATGKERNVKSGAVTIGTKRTLVFHTGRAPKGERTEWIMHEYCMSDTSQESLVVCRLRRNADFRLNGSSRGSSDPRISSAADNDHSATNEYANTHMDGFDEANAMKSFSKESTSSYRSHSVEQNDSGSEFDQQLLHDSPHGSSTPYKEYGNEDDCFADIINDDIIKLDESASRSLTLHGVLTGTKWMQKLPQETMSSSQGTAVRRIKLRRQKIRTHLQKPSSFHGDKNQNQQPSSDEKKPSEGCVVSVMAGTADTVSRFHPAYLILVFLFLLIVLFVARQGYYLNTKQHLGNSMEVVPK